MCASFTPCPTAQVLLQTAHATEQCPQSAQLMRLEEARSGIPCIAQVVHVILTVDFIAKGSQSEEATARNRCVTSPLLV